MHRKKSKKPKVVGVAGGPHLVAEAFFSTSKAAAHVYRYAESAVTLLVARGPHIGLTSLTSYQYEQLQGPHLIARGPLQRPHRALNAIKDGEVRRPSYPRLAASFRRKSAGLKELDIVHGHPNLKLPDPVGVEELKAKGVEGEGACEPHSMIAPGKRCREDTKRAF